MRRRGRLAVGIATLSLGIVATIAGAALLTTFGTDSGYDARSRLVTRDEAIVFDALTIGGVPIDGVRLEVDAASEAPVFIGIGPADEVATFLDGVGRERIVRIDPDGPFTLEAITGSRVAEPPGAQPWWVASAGGTDARIGWDVEPGAWALVVMHEDASQGIDVQVHARLTVPGSGPAGVVLAIAGVALILGGGAIMIRASR